MIYSSNRPRKIFARRSRRVLRSELAEGICNGPSRPSRSDRNCTAISEDFSSSNNASSARRQQSICRDRNNYLVHAYSMNLKRLQNILQFLYGPENRFLLNSTASQRRLFSDNPSYLNLLGGKLLYAT